MAITKRSAKLKATAPSASHPAASSEDRLRESIERLEYVIRALPDQYPYLFEPRLRLWMTFLRGIAYGMGAIAAVAIVVPFIVMLLEPARLIPFIGDFVVQVIQRIQDVR